MFANPPNQGVETGTFVNHELWGNDRTNIAKNPDKAFYIDILLLTNTIFEDNDEVRIAYQVRTNSYSSKFFFLCVFGHIILDFVIKVVTVSSNITFFKKNNMWLCRFFLLKTI